MREMRRNAKCLFLKWYRTVLSKKGMTNKPVKKLFSGGNLKIFFRL